MRRLLTALTLAGCTTAVPFDDPCACVIITEPNGALSLAVDGVAQQVDGDAGGSYDTTPITGYLTAAYDGRDVATFGVGISGLGGIVLSADLAPGAVLALPAQMALVDLFLDNTLRADTEFVDSVTYGLGPSGGALTVNEIEPRADGGWRVRGQYQGQACPDPAGGACIAVSGNFAFTARDLDPRIVDGFQPALN